MYIQYSIIKMKQHNIIDKQIKHNIDAHIYKLALQ